MQTQVRVSGKKAKEVGWGWGCGHRRKKWARFALFTGARPPIRLIGAVCIS